MKVKCLFVSLVLGLSLIVALHWTREGQSSATVAAALAPQSGDWDALRVVFPMVIRDSGAYHMWYGGRGLSFYIWDYGLGYAGSPDGLSWEKYADNPVLEPGEPGEWDSGFRGQVAVLKDDGIYKMWFSGNDLSGRSQTGYATSTDGLRWDIYPGNPVLEVGAPGSWDEQGSDGGSVIKDGDTFKMWYQGCDADATVYSIGYATSPDGVNWTKHAGNPVLKSTPGEWDDPKVYWPRVIKNGDTYELWYSSGGRIGLATSPDGITWTKYAGNPVLSEGWDGAGIGSPTLLLDGDTYKMWFSSGAGNSRGLGYAESTDGSAWTQPVSNPILLPGDSGVIIDANYYANHVRAQTLANTPITITVSHDGALKAIISGETDGDGWYRSWEHWEDWDPGKPDILPGDTVSAAADGYSTIIETIGEVDAQVHVDTDLVQGTIDAPWFAPDSLSVLCEFWTDPYLFDLDRDVPADGGAFQCDFAGVADIVGGQTGAAGYFEPDGDMVSVDLEAPRMEVYYGTRDGVGGIYAPGHSMWITVTTSAGDIKATAAVTGSLDGGWWGHGFRPTWTGGDCCEWSPAEPDIQPGDWVLYQSDDGYKNQVRVGTIFGSVDVEEDSVSGPIFARWLDQTLQVWCHPQTLWPPVYRQSSAEPDGSVPYLCEWQNPSGGQEPWDIQSESDVMVHYVEPDGDRVVRMMIASEGAPAHVVYLPLALR